MSKEIRDQVHFVIIFLLVSFNLRMAFSAADPLLVQIMETRHIGIGSSGLFGLLPIMSLGVAAPLGARLVEWVRPGMLIIYALLFATAGVFWRSSGGIPGLFGGTIVIGLGLGIAGAVILGIARQAVPQHLPELISAYTACVSLGTAVGAGAANPISLLLGGWQQGLMFWAIPLLLATAAWSVLMLKRRESHTRQPAMHAPMLPLLRQHQARMVVLYYLFRVASSWLLIVWLSALLRRRGMPAIEAGLVLSLATACQIPSALLAGIISHWLGGMKHLMTLASLAAIIACWGLLVLPLHWWLGFALLLGLGLGCIFSIGMTLIATTEPNEAGTIALSGLAQGIGFIGGGLLAWLAGLSLQFHAPDMWIAGLYTCFTFTGLFFGLSAANASPRTNA